VVKMAQTHPLKFIAFLLGLLALFIVSSTDLFAIPATGSAQTGAVEYIHVDVATNGQLNVETNVMITLTDQAGKPVTGRIYGSRPGQFSIPTNGLKDVAGNSAFFTVESDKIQEIKDAANQGTGVYKVPIIIKNWAGGATSPVYTLEARYVGGDANTGDGASSDTYQLIATTSLTAGSAGESNILKFSPVSILKNTLLVPALQPGQPEPPAVVKTVTFRVKLIGQARDAVTNTRMFSGRADTPEELANWTTPIAFDNTGATIKAEYGRIREEVVPLLAGQRVKYKGSGVYQVEVKLTCPAGLAGRKAAVTIGRVEGEVTASMSATVNFASSGAETTAAENPNFANPYLVNPPSTPQVVDLDFAGVQPGNIVTEFPAGTTEYPTNGDFMVAEDGSRVAINYVRLRAIIEDPDGYNVSAAEFFRQQDVPSPTQDGTGTPMLAIAPGFSLDPTKPDESTPATSSLLDVYYDIPASTLK
jgi:hypothetical protein